MTIMKHRVLITVSVFFTISLCYSCMGGKKARAKAAVENSKQLLSEEAKQLAATTERKEQALQLEKIDTTINNRITQRLVNFQKSMDTIRQSGIYIEQALSNKKQFRKQYKTTIVAALKKLEEYSSQSPLRIYKINMINEAIRISDKKLYELAAFFGPGKYIIPDEKKDLAIAAFAPLTDSLILFANQYDSIPSTATFVVNGFADGTGFSPTSELYATLLAYLKKETAQKEELNIVVSGFRAAEISSLIEGILKKRAASFKATDKIQFQFYGYGQGETFPTKSITDYTVDDVRRRIVLVYWSVLPD
jgi:hypothetical protein